VRKRGSQRSADDPPQKKKRKSYSCTDDRQGKRGRRSCADAQKKEGGTKTSCSPLEKKKGRKNDGQLQPKSPRKNKKGKVVAGPGEKLAKGHKKRERSYKRGQEPEFRTREGEHVLPGERKEEKRCRPGGSTVTQKQAFRVQLKRKQEKKKRGVVHVERLPEKEGWNERTVKGEVPSPCGIAKRRHGRNRGKKEKKGGGTLTHVTGTGS